MYFKYICVPQGQGFVLLDNIRNSSTALIQVHKHFRMLLLDGSMWKTLQMPIFRHMRMLQLVEDIVWLREWCTTLKLWRFYVNFTLRYNFQRSKINNFDNFKNAYNLYKYMNANSHLLCPILLMLYLPIWFSAKNERIQH